ncbi:MAG: hypothetical protein ABWY36_02740 [Leifsonia sp.]
MPHDYPLHTDLEAVCLCCGSLQPFTFASASDQVVCAHCRAHLGPEKAERRDRQHIALWTSIWESERAAHRSDADEAAAAAAEQARVRSGLEARVAELSATVIGQFDAAPESGIRDALQSELVRRAERATELANRRNDRMMAVLWRIGAMHNADGARCTCGRSLVDCPEYRAVTVERAAIEEWESKNLAMLRAGKRHGLPADHPAVAATSSSVPGGAARRRPARSDRR